ncbi:MAG: hypothetical protein DRO76_06240 [Candidatus Altiarchaeales archaeon]|nr:MAG: hypothetical protein DRO76_06240 [Candidatus Altiarchaeales archaeon]
MLNKCMIVLNIETDEISYKAKILTIQVRGSNLIKIWRIWDYKNEEELLRNFVRWFLREKDKVILGYNLLKFDLPLLLLKTAFFPEFEKFSMKINRANILDLFVILTFLNKGRIKSLEFYCKEIKKEIVPREELLQMYENKLYPEMERSLVKNLSAINELFSVLWKSVDRDRYPNSLLIHH